METINQKHTEKYSLYNGDSCEVLKSFPDNSTGYCIYSPPFADLYVYSNSERDLGNCGNYEEFFKHYEFIAKELFRVLKEGRSVSFHCMNIPAMKQKDGFIGVKDFRGDLIRLFQNIGFIYHSEVVIWKDPLIEATRTKALGLMHKQLQKDSYICRQGLPDYLVTMRKPGENMEPIQHSEGFTEYYGKDEPKVEGIKYSHLVWQRYASPVWMDIRQTHTLNRNPAREEKDEKHLCPLQLDTIARGIALWSNPGDIVLTPFAGIGSEVYQSIKMGRKGVGIELKESYYNQAVLNCESVQDEAQVDFFSL